MSKKTINQADKPPFPGEEQHFSQGLRVLVVDDNVVCLRSLTHELQKCGYRVTMTTKAVKALEMLRKNKDAYDIVITDAITSDMDGFKLLEIIGLEMDIPVIMTSENSDVKNIEKGVKHGACDYLVKPVRIEILRNIWQHVIRKTIYDTRPAEKIAADRRSTRDIVLYKRNQRREDLEAFQSHNEEPLVRRKTRAHWTPELHAKFLAAVQQLREGAAVPKKILALMKEPQLTRKQVASHLQKYRASLKQVERTRQQSKNHLDASRTTHTSREPDNKSFSSQSPLLLPPDHHPDPFLQQQNPVLPSKDANQVLQTMTIPTLTPAPILTIDPHCQPDFNAIQCQPIQYQRNGITRPLNEIVSCASGALISHLGTTTNHMSPDSTGQITLFSQPESITGLLLQSSLPGNHEPRNLATFGKGGSDFKGEARATGTLVDMRGQVDGPTEIEHVDCTQFLLLDNSDGEIHGGYQYESAPYDDLSSIFSEDPAPNL